MSWGDVASVVENLAPTIASVIGGPLAGSGVSALEKLFGLTPAPSASSSDRLNDVAAAIAGATPDQLMAMKKANQDYALAMATLGFKDTEALASLNVQDRVSARDMEVSTKSIMAPMIGSAIILGSLAAAAAILFGKVSYANTTEATMVGTVVGYLFSEAKAVLSFYFGSTSDTGQVNTLLANSTQTPPAK
jgi:hypothetical protein